MPLWRGRQQHICLLQRTNSSPPPREGLGCFHVQESLLSWSMGEPEFRVHSMRQVLPLIHIHPYLKHQRASFVCACTFVLFTQANWKYTYIKSSNESAPCREATLIQVSKRPINILTLTGGDLVHYCILFCMFQNLDWHSNCQHRQQHALNLSCSSIAQLHSWRNNHFNHALLH